jgi:REP element-mobilizing transposase RayT
MRVQPRVPPRLDRTFDSRPLYFVTFNVERRRPVLATAEVHRAFVHFAEQAYTGHNIAVGRYVIMPQHVHLFVGGDESLQLGRWIGLLKQHLGKAVVAPLRPLWQRGFFDHVLRSDESYSEKWKYVRDNPIRAGLADDADEWPYAGEIIPIDRA